MSGKGRTVENETRAGRAQQDAATQAAAGTAARCGEAATFGRSTFHCIRPPHGGNHPHTDTWRRRRGQSVSADHHYFVGVTA